MNKENIEKILLLGYILLNGMFTGRTVNAIMTATDGHNSINNIIINAAIVALTAQRAIHYYKLTKGR